MAGLRIVGALIGFVIIGFGLAGAVGVVPGLCVAGAGTTACGGVTYITVTFSHGGGGESFQVSVTDTTPSSTGINSNFQQTWYWGDGNITGPHAWSRNSYTHTYAKSGAYTIELTDNAGEVVGEASAVVSVGGASGAHVSISCNPTNCVQYVGNELAVEAVATPTGPFNYNWTGYPAGQASGTTDQELVLLSTTPAGSWTVTVKVTDSDTGAVVGTASQSIGYAQNNTTCGGTGEAKCPVQNLTITAVCTPTNCDPTVNETGVVVSLSVTGSNGPFTASWGVTVPGLNPSSNGMFLSGTPTVIGTYNLTANVVNSADAHGYVNVTVVVSESNPCPSTGCPCPVTSAGYCVPPPPTHDFNLVTSGIIFGGIGVVLLCAPIPPLPWRLLGFSLIVVAGLVVGYVAGGV
jgi:hypothetical protein